MTHIDHFKTVPTKTNEQIDFILLDGSGSMHSKWWDMLLSIDGFVNTIREQSFESRILLSTFGGDNIGTVVRDVKVSQWTSLYDHPIGMPEGGTPLYDAINLLGRTLRDLDPPRATIVIATDGGEGGSQHTSQEQAKAIIEWMKAKGWQVVFMGVDFNNSRLGHDLGATPEQILPVKQKKLLAAAERLATKRTQYGIYGTDINFTKDEKNEFGGFLTGPSAEGGSK